MHSVLAAQRNPRRWRQLVEQMTWAVNLAGAEDGR